MGLARAFGFQVISTQQRRKSQQTIGQPDLYFLLPNKGGVLFFEVKQQTGTLSKEQALFGLYCHGAGVPWGCGTVGDFCVLVGRLRGQAVPMPPGVVMWRGRREVADLMRIALGPEPRKVLPAWLTPGNPGNAGGKKGRSGRKPKPIVGRTACTRVNCSDGAVYPFPGVLGMTVVETLLVCVVSCVIGIFIGVNNPQFKKRMASLEADVATLKVSVATIAGKVAAAVKSV